MADTPWRLIVDHNSYADFSVSVSPAVEAAVVAGEVLPTVFLNIFDSDSMTVGVNEDPEQVLDLDFCRAKGIPFRRRVNGGGVVYAGAGSAFLVLFLPTSHPRVPDNQADAFPTVLTAIAEVFRERYGFAAEYRPLNDIQVEGRKLVPTSLKIEDGVSTFRIVINVKAVDTEIAAGAMPMPPEKIVDKQIKDVRSRFTWLEREAARDISEDELVAFARHVTSHTFGETELVQGELTEAERRYADEFRARFDTDDWLYGKSRRNRIDHLLKAGDSVGTGRVKAMGGMIWVTLALRRGKVLAAIVNGDWHPRPIASVAWLEDALAGSEAEASTLRRCAADFLVREDVEYAGVTPDDLGDALEKALAVQESTC